MFLTAARRMSPMPQSDQAKTRQTGNQGMVIAISPQGRLIDAPNQRVSAMFTRPRGHPETLRAYLEQTRPETILIVDLARGSLGVEARRYLDTLQRDSGFIGGGPLRLDGIELFADEIPDYRRPLYDSLHPGQAIEVIERLGSYDMIVLGDVLGRQEKEQALAFLDACFARTLKALAVFIPLGKTWPGKFPDEIRITPRRSFWFFADFAGFAAQRAVFDTPYGPYAAFLMNYPAASCEVSK
jgi:hypothetical protein